MLWGTKSPRSLCHPGRAGRRQQSLLPSIILTPSSNEGTQTSLGSPFHGEIPPDVQPEHPLAQLEWGEKRNWVAEGAGWKGFPFQEKLGTSVGFLNYSIKQWSNIPEDAPLFSVQGINSLKVALASANSCHSSNTWEQIQESETVQKESYKGRKERVKKKKKKLCGKWFNILSQGFFHVHVL